MISGIAAFIPVLLVAFTALVLLISAEWRLSIAALLVQYIGVSLLVQPYGLLGLSLAKLMSGWIAAVVLSMAMVSTPGIADREIKAKTAQVALPEVLSGRIFRLLASVLVFLVTLSIAPAIPSFVPGAQLPQAYGALTLAGMGLLQLGLTNRPFRTVIGLLTALSGFEILYISVETSALVTGLLAAVTLGLALVGAYLLIAPFEEQE